MLKGSARTFGDLHFSYLPEAKRPANRWQQMKKKSLSPRRSFSPNTSFELPYRTRSPVCSSSDEDEKIEVGNRASRSPAPSPSLGSCTDVEPHNKGIDPACYVDNLDLDPDASSISEGQKYEPTMTTPTSSPRILDLGLSTPPPEGYMDDFITGVFVTLDDNGEPVFPDDEDDKVPREKKATPSAFLFLGDNGNFSVLKKENVNANAGSHTKREWDSEGSEEGDHGSKMAAFKEKLLLEGVGSGYAADLPGGYGIFHSKASGKRVLCYD